MQVRTLLNRETERLSGMSAGYSVTTKQTMATLEPMTSDEATSRVRVHRGLALSLIGIVIALYLPTVGYDFVNWDDPWYVINNPLIKS
jgi:hypothetical protein